MKLQIVLGSESDQEVVRASKMTEVLDAVGIDYDAHVYSAHRNPDDLSAFVREALEQGAEMFIGVAGMAAALPGAIAGATKMTVPVLGVPLDKDGIDSCLYMPPGVPVATMGVGIPGLRNAAIFACQVLTRGRGAQAGEFQNYLARTAKSPKYGIGPAGIRPS
ncbi:AIR carboxylase family protein [Candidatus Saccharibacteria bacterium]|nr:AIR carboxylase family protein [Candidatus Saccharibacteria bacterium]